MSNSKYITDDTLFFYDFLNIDFDADDLTKFIDNPVSLFYNQMIGNKYAFITNLYCIKCLSCYNSFQNSMINDDGIIDKYNSVTRTFSEHLRIDHGYKLHI